MYNQLRWNNERSNSGKNLSSKARRLHYIHHFILVKNIQVIVFQVRRSVELALLVERLQDERAAVALNIFLNRTSGQESVAELQKFSRNELNITRFDIITVCSNICNVYDLIQSVIYMDDKLIFMYCYIYTRIDFSVSEKPILFFRILGSGHSLRTSTSLTPSWNSKSSIVFSGQR